MVTNFYTTHYFGDLISIHPSIHFFYLSQMPTVSDIDTTLSERIPTPHPHMPLVGLGRGEVPLTIFHTPKTNPPPHTHPMLSPRQPLALWMVVVVVVVQSWCGSMDGGSGGGGSSSVVWAGTSSMQFRPRPPSLPLPAGPPPPRTPPSLTPAADLLSLDACVYQGRVTADCSHVAAVQSGCGGGGGTSGCGSASGDGTSGFPRKSRFSTMQPYAWIGVVEDAASASSTVARTSSVTLTRARLHRFASLFTSIRSMTTEQIQQRLHHDHQQRPQATRMMSFLFPEQQQPQPSQHPPSPTTAEIQPASGSSGSGSGSECAEEDCLLATGAMRWWSTASSESESMSSMSSDDDPQPPEQQPHHRQQRQQQQQQEEEPATLTTDTTDTMMMTTPSSATTTTLCRASAPYCAVHYILSHMDHQEGRRLSVVLSRLDKATRQLQVVKRGPVGILVLDGRSGAVKLSMRSPTRYRPQPPAAAAAASMSRSMSRSTALSSPSSPATRSTMNPAAALLQMLPLPASLAPLAPPAPPADGPRLRRSRSLLGGLDTIEEAMDDSNDDATSPSSSTSSSHRRHRDMDVDAAYTHAHSNSNSNTESNSNTDSHSYSSDMDAGGLGIGSVVVGAGDVVITGSRGFWRWASDLDVAEEVGRTRFALSDHWSHLADPHDFVDTLLESLLQRVHERAYKAGDRHARIKLAISLVV